MPNNFRLTGDYYVSKAGNDANAGTSPDAPKRTIQSVLTLITTGTRTVIIGSGVYSENLTSNVSSVATITFFADGNVVLEGRSTLNLILTTGHVNTTTFNFYGFEIRNYLSVQLYNTTNGTGGTSHLFYDCKFTNNPITQYGGNTTASGYTRCIFLNCTLSFPSVAINLASLSYDSCIFLNTSMLAVFPVALPFSNCYTNYSSTINLRSGITGNNFNYNNLEGPIIINTASSVTSGVIQDTYGRYYDLSLAGSGGSGTIADPYRRSDTLGKSFYFSAHRTAYPTLNPSSSSTPPKFNDVENQDLTLQADSWHIGRASNGVSNIGSTKYALRRAANISFSGSQATVDPSLIFQYNNYIISGSQVTGSITSAPIAVSPLSSSKVIQKVTYNGLLAFNKDTGSASGSNQNVPDFDTFTSASGNAAANPDRLVYYMRHTTGSSIPVADAGWDNGGLWTAGQYNVFEWNTKPSIDNLGVGNGSGSFNAAASPTYIQATYVQMQVKLRNDYLL